MIKNFTVFVFLMFFIVSVQADNVSSNCTLQWDFTPNEEPIDGFKLYNNGSLFFTINDGEARSVSCVAAGLVPGNYVLALTAFNSEDESGMSSDPLHVTIFKLPFPSNLRVTITIQ